MTFPIFFGILILISVLLFVCLEVVPKRKFVKISTKVVKPPSNEPARVSFEDDIAYKKANRNRYVPEKIVSNDYETKREEIKRKRSTSPSSDISAPYVTHSYGSSSDSGSSSCDGSSSSSSCD